MMKPPVCTILMSFIAALSLSACGGDDADTAPPPPPPSYTVGGSITGLAGSGLTLRNGSETITLTAGAARFTFANALLAGSSYSVSVGAQPSVPAQTCTVSNASGTIANASINNLVVECKADPLFNLYVLRGSTDRFSFASITTAVFDPDRDGIFPVGTTERDTCLSSITTNRQNRLVFTNRSISPLPNSLGSCPSTFKIASIDPITGRPDIAGSSPYAEENAPTQAIIHPNGIDFYILRASASEFVVYKPTGELAPYRFDASGDRATPSGSAVALGMAPRSGAIANNANRLIVTNQGALSASGGSARGDVRVVDITNPEQPTPLSTYNAITAPYAVAVHPSAPYVYVLSATGTEGHALALNDAGVLAPIGGGTFQTPGGVRSMVMGPEGRTLYAVGYDSNLVQAYSISSNGMPVPIGGPLPTNHTNLH